MSTPYDRINTLEEFEMIAGDAMTLVFNVVDENDLPVDITTGTSSWKICPYGDPTYVALSLSGNVTDTSQFEVELATSDTQDLSGKYIQQVIHVDFSGQEFRKQGVLTIVPRIQ